jgi:TatD DNase family protein
MDPMIDTHAHLDVDAFDEDRDAVLDRSVAAGVTQWIVPAVEPAAVRRALKAPWRRPGIHFAAGIHPHEAGRLGLAAVDTVETLIIEHPEIVAVGEAGLDYHYHPEEADRQLLLFEAQIDLAVRYNRPMIVHLRNGTTPGLDAYKDAIELIGGRSVRGVFHSFTGPYEAAVGALDRGWLIGVNGIITFKQSHDLRATIGRIPVARILPETDCPYLAPIPFRGRRNEPARMIATLSFLSQLMKIEEQRAVIQLEENAMSFFELTERRSIAINSPS